MKLAFFWEGNLTEKTIADPALRESIGSVDLHPDGPNPYALLRDSTIKDKDKRTVPLKRELADAFLVARLKDCDFSKKVFWFAWPTYDVMEAATNLRPHPGIQKTSLWPRRVKGSLKKFALLIPLLISHLDKVLLNPRFGIILFKYRKKASLKHLYSSP
jgi:hypothetical protein